ncbi:MAG TPA: SOS response-associated peptidase [Bacteroidia bacterium]|nr:SOS response-associated peptidase [Bacteroidia bacterium]
MCYNLEYIERRGEKYAARYKDSLPPSWKVSQELEELPTYYFVSGFSHPKLPIVKHDGIFPFSWGLIPSWARDTKTAEEISGKTLNAVGETVFEKPSFKKSIASKRCLLGVNGFYEWRDLNKVKYPYLIHATDNELFSLGCIYETWLDKSTGEIHNTFSILTTPANPMMEIIHNIKKRMPLIIAPQDEPRWIDPSLKPDEIKAMIKSFPENQMSAFTVSRNANSAKNNRNVPQIIEQINYPELN